MPHIINDILMPVLLVLSVGNFIADCFDASLVRIVGPRIVPEHGELTLKCEVAPGVRNISISWHFSENNNSLNANVLDTTVKGKSVLQIQHMLRQETHTFNCCLGSFKFICATHSVIVLYTTLDRQIMRLDDSSGALILTQATESVPSHFDFDICLAVGRQLENVEIDSSSGTFDSDHFCSNSTSEKNGDSRRCLHISYSVKHNAQTDNRLLAINFTHGVSVTTYYLYVLLNGKPRPMMNDIIIQPRTVMIELSCWGTAIPAPKVTISFTPCPSLDWSKCNSSTATLDEIITYSSIPTITFNASVRVVGSHLPPGIVHCKAANSEGTSYTRSRLFRRNQREVIMLQQLHPNTVLYAGDSITVRCSVDCYNFTNRFTFYAQNQRHQVLGQRDTYSWVAEFTVTDLAISDNQIECQSQHQNGSLVTKRLTFTIVQPYISAQDRLRYLMIEHNTPLLLSCNVIGKPMPEYRWFKHDVQLPNTNFMMVMTPSEGDQFDCYAKNRAGEVRLTWVIANSNETSVDFGQLTLVITLLFVFTIGVVCCYFKARQLCTLLRSYRAGVSKLRPSRVSSVARESLQCGPRESPVSYC
ncbi:uncharacterized protein LOC128710971 [Anopheles marshallii]|uniref:uncharacterized protein LOC128710971 n=1 Tax=Anopheles marshallii TaxID=1521116 RepID=UPI00237BC414|nr:uncharacterized protein LOC128710971 [Anopheles marshallii]